MIENMGLCRCGHYHQSDGECIQYLSERVKALQRLVSAADNRANRHIEMLGDLQRRVTALEADKKLEAITVRHMTPEERSQQLAALINAWADEDAAQPDGDECPVCGGVWKALRDRGDVPGGDA